MFQMFINSLLKPKQGHNNYYGEIITQVIWGEFTRELFGPSAYFTCLNTATSYYRCFAVDFIHRGGVYYQFATIDTPPHGPRTQCPSDTESPDDATRKL